MDFVEDEQPQEVCLISTGEPLLPSLWGICLYFSLNTYNRVFNVSSQQTLESNISPIRASFSH